MEEALADYERRRNETSAVEDKQNLSAARFDPMPASLADSRSRSLESRRGHADDDGEYGMIESREQPAESPAPGRRGEMTT